MQTKAVKIPLYRDHSLYLYKLVYRANRKRRAKAMHTIAYNTKWVFNLEASVGGVVLAEFGLEK